MNMPYREQSLPVREDMQQKHLHAIDAFGQPGIWLDAHTRVQILKETRNADGCRLCKASAAALSPYSVNGNHDTTTALPATIVEIIHRIKTDSGRLTEAWLNRTLDDEVTGEKYIEIVGLIATSIIIDTFSASLGCALITPPEPIDDKPTRISNPQVFNGGAWLPMLDVAQEATPIDLPTSPNIFRALGLVPAAIDHFFTVMRAHYALQDLDYELSRSQTELLASRISSHNQCFY